MIGPGIVLAALVLAGAAPPAEPFDPARSVVQVVNVSQAPDYDSPWNSKSFQVQRGSGAVIEGGLILTSAHAVSFSRYLEVKKENSPGTYQAEVAFIGHDCDLALLTVADPVFLEGTVPLPLSRRLPSLGSVVEVYGFPQGGERVTVTKGVVSRVDYTPYSHSGNDTHLILQIDAAINPGNSGGPVVQAGEIVGIAFQAVFRSENVGQVIPITVIAHFFEDIADGRYDGYPDLGIVTGELINPDYRAFLEVPEGRSGVAVHDVIEGRSAGGKIFPGDILLEIDGRPIRNDGTILLDGRSYRLDEAAERKQCGDTVVFRVLRSGEVRPVEVVLETPSDGLKRRKVYDRGPEYFVFGGLVFEPLSRDYLETWGTRWRTKADRRLLHYYFGYYRDRLYRARPEPVVLVRVLPAAFNRYVDGLRDLIVDRADGRPVDGLAGLIAALEENRGPFHVIEFEGEQAPLVLDAAAVEEGNDEVLRRYGIARDRDLAVPEGGGGR